MRKKFFFLTRDKILYNFLKCITWEDKYYYIIELGSYLLNLHSYMYRMENIITGCQSKVWIVISYNLNKKIFFFGYSDSSIIKGLISIIFVFYKNLSKYEILTQDIYSFLNSLSLANYLTSSRSQGIQSIIQIIHAKLILLKF